MCAATRRACTVKSSLLNSFHCLAQVYAYAEFQDWSQGGATSACAATLDEPALQAITGEDILFPAEELASLTLACGALDDQQMEGYCGEQPPLEEVCVEDLSVEDAKAACEIACPCSTPGSLKNCEGLLRAVSPPHSS